MLGIGLQPASPGVGLVTVGNDRGPLPPLAVAGGHRGERRAGAASSPTPRWRCCRSPPRRTTSSRSSLDAATAGPLPSCSTRRSSTTDTEVLTFYKPVRARPAGHGQARPGGRPRRPGQRHHRPVAVDRAAGPKGARPRRRRRRSRARPSRSGSIPTAPVPGQVVLPEHTGTPTTDPGLVVEIAAPAPRSERPGRRPGWASARPATARLPITYAEPVLDAPGLIQVTLPRVRAAAAVGLRPGGGGHRRLPAAARRPAGRLAAGHLDPAALPAARRRQRRRGATGDTATPVPPTT